MFKKNLLALYSVILCFNCLGMDEDDSKTSSAVTTVLKIYDSQLHQVSNFTDQSREIIRTAEELISLNTTHSQQSVSTKKEEVKAGLVAIEANIDNVGRRDDRIQFSESGSEADSHWTLNKWLAKTLEKEEEQVDIREITDADFHKVYSLGGTHEFQVDYTKKIEYTGNVKCERAGWGGSCDNSVKYIGTVDHKDKAAAQCDKEHHKCLCVAVYQLSDRLEKKTLQYEKLKKCFFESKKLTAELLSLKSNVLRLSDGVTELSMQVIQPLVHFDQLRDKFNTFSVVASMGLTCQQNMEKARETISLITEQVHQENTALCKKQVEDAAKREEEFKKEAAESRKKISEKSEEFAQTLDARHQEFYKAIEKKRDDLIQTYETKLETLMTEKKDIEEKYNLSKDNLNDLQRKTEASTIVFFRLLMKLASAKTSDCSKGLSEKIADFQDNLEEKTFTDLLVLAKKASLEF